MTGRSAIDSAIDEATGFKPEEWVRLLCPGCGRRQLAKRDETDPPGTHTVRVHCPKCNGGDFDEVFYLDAAGNELQFQEDAPS